MATIAGFHGQVGFAGGIGMTSDDVRWQIKAAVTVSPSTAGGTDVGGVGDCLIPSTEVGVSAWRHHHQDVTKPTLHENRGVLVEIYD